MKSKKLKKKDEILTILMPYIKEKEVLDVGCVGQDIKRKNQKKIWVHDFLKEHAKHVIGIDIAKKEIEYLKRKGYDVHCMNAEDFEINKKYSVIFAGELIEHLSNPGLFLQRCGKHLAKEGYLILTTPNAFNLYRLILSLLMFNNNPPVNKRHTMWFSPKVMATLLDKNGFNLINFRYAIYPDHKPRWDIHLCDLFSKLFPKLKSTMIIVSKKK